MLQINSSELCFYKMCKTRPVKILIAAVNQIEFRTFKIIQTTRMHIIMIKKQTTTTTTKWWKCSPCCQRCQVLSDSKCCISELPLQHWCLRPAEVGCSGEFCRTAYCRGLLLLQRCTSHKWVSFTALLVLTCAQL